jgi:hypothetical protein
MSTEMDATEMSEKSDSLILAVFCLLVMAFSAAGLAWLAVGGTVTGIDALLLAFTCLLMGGLFFLMLLMVARQQGWIPGGKKSAPPSEEGK